MSIERDQDFERLEDIAAMIAENPGIEFEDGKYVYYGLDPRTAFAVVYIGGAWAGWQAKTKAAQEGYVLIEREKLAMIFETATNALIYQEASPKHGALSIIQGIARKSMIEAQVPNHTLQFNLDELLIMEEKLKHKGGVIAADLDRFIAYAEMVLEKAKAFKEPK